MNEELSSLLAIKSNSEARVIASFERIRFAAWLFGMLAVGLIAVTTWVLSIQFSLQQVNRELEKQDARSKIIYKQVFHVEPY